MLAAELIEDGIVHPRSDNLAEVTFAAGFDGDGGGQRFDGELLRRLALGLRFCAQRLFDFFGDVAKDQGHGVILRCARGVGKAVGVHGGPTITPAAPAGWASRSCGCEKGGCPHFRPAAKKVDVPISVCPHFRLRLHPRGAGATRAGGGGLVAQSQPRPLTDERMPAQRAA